METVCLITGMFLVTFAVRYILFPLSGRLRFSSGLQRTLNHVPPAVLAAIIVPAAVMPDGRTLQLAANPYLLGAMFTALIGWYSRNLLITIVGGMMVFAICRWVLVLVHS